MAAVLPRNAEARTSRLSIAALVFAGVSALAYGTIMTRTVKTPGGVANLILLCGLTALIGVILGAIALLVILIGRGRVSGILPSTAALGISVPLLILVLGALGAARGGARRVRCQSNLKQLGYALSRYVGDSSGKLPGSLDDLAPRYLLDAGILKYPGCSEEESYRYISLGRAALPGNCIVAYDVEGNHDGGRNVLFLNGTPQWLGEADFRKYLDAMRQSLERVGVDVPAE
ncbi:MAG: DUF1559 family PulG-like putative transporter [Planctomycetota bacterium]|jgi:hypothetical protein